jgi:hypothetical protein
MRHEPDAHAADRGVRRRFLADAVVLHAEDNRVVSGVQVDPNDAAAGVLDGVRDGFLGDPKQVRRRLRISDGDRPVASDVARNAGGVPRLPLGRHGLGLQSQKLGEQNHDRQKRHQ